MGRSLRRQSYELNDEGRVRRRIRRRVRHPLRLHCQAGARPAADRRAETVQVKAAHAGARRTAEIQLSSRRGLPRRTAATTSLRRCVHRRTRRLELTPEVDGSDSITRIQGIIGEGHRPQPWRILDGVRRVHTCSTNLTGRLLVTKHFRDENGEPKLHLFGQLKRIAAQWLRRLPRVQRQHLPGAADVSAELADGACERIIKAGVTRAASSPRARPVKAVLDPVPSRRRHPATSTSPPPRTQRYTHGRAPLPS